MQITEDFCGVIFEIVCRWNFFYVDLQCPQQQPLCWQTLNDGFSTMSDGSHGILIEIFLIAAQNLSVELFQRMPTFFCAQSVWTYNEVAIELAAAVFIKRLQQHGHEFRDESKLLATETLQNLARFLLVFILIHGN